MANSWSRDFGLLIHSQRMKKKLPLRKVAAALDIDTSTLSKIEKGDRQANSKMIPIIAELFQLGYKELQIQYLSQKIKDEFSKEPFYTEAISALMINAHNDEPTLKEIKIESKNITKPNRKRK